MQNKKILLGITGSIAAYKSIILIRQLRELGAIVKVVLTTAGAQFVTPLTLQAVSGNPVYQQLLDADSETQFSHIDLARWADEILIAPASADFIAKLAHGFANDLLSTLCLASDCPLIVAPAMNQQMWSAPATVANVEMLRQRHVRFLDPETGIQACGETGAGRLLEPEKIVQALQAQTQILAGLNLMITAGATREDIDPVRFISNRSSGKMGFALAQAAQQMGANVTLVCGVVHLITPIKVKRLDCYSAADMYDTVHQHIENIDIFISTAAVADYRPVQAQNQKIKKNNQQMQIEMERTQDILASVSQRQPRPFCVGFAAETDNLIEYAQMKLKRKKLDMIAANWVGKAGSGFDSENNALHVLWQEGEQQLPNMNKKQLAIKLLQLIEQRFH